MGERKISPKSGRPARFDIDLDPTQQSNFPDQRPISVVLSDSVMDQYDVYQKEIPVSLKGRRLSNGNMIRWLNNYGVKRKGGANYEEMVPAYILVLDNISGVEYVYHDPTSDSVLPLLTSPYPDDATKVQASLTLGDPAVGIG